MRRFVFWAMFVVLTAPRFADAVCTKCVAVEITAANASQVLIGGSDAAGGIGDWYLTNKKVEAIIDDVATLTVPTVGGSTTVNATSSNAVATGGTLVDVALYKKTNDQLPQSFQVGGLSLAQVMLFRPGDETPWGGSGNPCASVEGSNATCPAETGCASITTYGIGLFPNVSTPTAPTLRVKTRYQACDGEQQLRLRTEVWNVSGGAVGPLPVIDVFLWGGRGIDAFLPAAGRGYNHPELDLSQAAALITGAPYFFAPGNVNVKDGKMHRNKKAKEVSYGYITGIGGTPCGQDDPDGPFGGMPPANILGLGANDQIGLHGNLLSAGILPLLGGTIPDNSSRIFSRRLIVGKRNDGNSVTGDVTNPSSIFTQFGYGTGKIAGAVSPGSSEEGTVTFVRVSGPLLIPDIADNSPVTSIRTKGGFNVVLPEGDYVAHAVFPGRDDIFTDPPVTVTFNATTPLTVDASGLPKVGKVTGLVVDASNANAAMPAKISFAPIGATKAPGFHRDFEAMSFDLDNGMCSNNLSLICTNDIDCGANTCFRTCTNLEPTRCTTTPDCDTGAGEVCASDGRCRRHACDTAADCDPGNLCRANTASIVPESFPGGAAQLSVIYTHDGKINQNVRPGTYDVYVSRGLEYSIKKLASFVVTPTGVSALNGGSPISLTKVAPTTGWVSADFHIHSGRSLDSSAPLEARVRSFAAEGVDVMVSTDHDIVTDYNPAIKKLKLESQIGSIVGTEVTTSVGTPPYYSNSWGHVNAWPQRHDSSARRSGSEEDENVSLNVVLDRLRGSLAANANNQCIGGTNGGNTCEDSTDCKGGGACVDVGTPVTQLNHVRAGVSGVVAIGLFSNVGYNPSALITDCQKYPVICGTSQCFGGTNDGVACVTSATCTGGGVCGCVSASLPSMANGCNNQLLDLNVVPQATICDTPGCGGGFEITTGTRNIDADMMEIDNGGNASGWPGTKMLRRDWISLLNQGVEVGQNGSRHPMWGTGVSDTHRLIAEIPGYSRQYVQAGNLPNPSLGLDVKNFNEEVVAGNMYGTTGPLFDVEADNGSTTVELGGTLDASGGTVNLDVSVTAAPWIPIEEVRIIKNGCILACYNNTTLPVVMNDPPADRFDQDSSDVLRFSATIPDTVTEDSYYIVEASPNLPVSGGAPVDATVNAVAAGVLPYGFTNPIFADFDGGGYSGIGVPEPVCGALPASCSAGAAVASMPSATMFAKADPAKDLSWLDRVLAALVPSVEAHDDGPVPEDEEERLRLHEETIRKQGPEYFPRQFFVIPTPAPAPAEKAAAPNK